MRRRLSSFRPMPGAPMRTIGRYSPGLGYNLATSSYVAISSRSKSSFSVSSYMIFLVLGLDAQRGDFGDWLHASTGKAEEHIPGKDLYMYTYLVDETYEILSGATRHTAVHTIRYTFGTILLLLGPFENDPTFLQGSAWD